MNPIATTLLGLGVMLAAPASAAVLYSNLTPTSQIALATSPATNTMPEVEAADDFLLASRSTVTSASFTGLLVPGTLNAASVVQVVIEIYRVFPNDSNTARTGGAPTFGTPQVPTRVNSPSDVEFVDRDSSAGGLSFTVSTLSANFSTLNSIAANGINPIPNQTTGGNGPVTGQEVQFDVTFTTPLDLPADHYFFVPQVLLSGGGQFYWLSAPRPIGAGGTPFAPDLQVWVRNTGLDPDWLRAGTDIVGGTPAPTFNAAFALNGTALPEPPMLLLMIPALGLMALRRRSASRAARRRAAIET